MRRRLTFTGPTPKAPEPVTDSGAFCRRPRYAGESQTTSEYLQRDTATLSRYETGFYPIRRPDLFALLDLYGISDASLRDKLLNLSKDVWQKGWWDGYADDVAGHLIDYIWLESRATHIRSFAAMVVPGLLQTPDYAREVIRINEPGATSDQIDRWLELRLTRQQILEGDTPTRLSAVMDEAVLHRQIGDPRIMETQLRHLADRSASPGLDLRVLPFRADTPASTYGTFEIFELPPPFPEVAFTETMAGAIYMEAPESERFVYAYSGHESRSLRQTDSADLLLATAREWQ